MYEIHSQIYEKTAQKLSDAIGSERYFAGTIEFTHEDVECRMRVTVMLYHKEVDAPEGCYCVVDDIVPIWWEFHTVIDGVERLNDFDFTLLKRYIVD